ncbi:MAG: PD-(D/E)XK nuclease family protein, partial [Bacteroidales bacterium]|nr:PD-(D/E)XK nuclease family protein [Bacteroidales bacterium]
SDFNEIDAWLIDPKQIYRNIKDLKEIDSKFDWLTDEQKKLLKNFWANFLSEKSSSEKDMFLHLWNLLPTVYELFTEQLKERRIAYNGLIYRVLSEMIADAKIETDNSDKYIFIGFNALNNAELKFFKYFQKKGIAEFYWDIDDYYFSGKKQEAGDFLRKNFEELNIKIPKLPNNFLKEKNINLIGTSLNINQAKLLHVLLKDKNKNFLNNTAIITADETMLFPILSALPDFAEQINVTMGYSFKLTPLFNFINSFFRLHMFPEKHKNPKFYYKNVLSILKHPYLNEYDAELCSKLTDFIKSEKLFYILPEQLPFGNDKLMNLLFDNFFDNGNINLILNNLLNILFLFFDNKTTEDKTQSNSVKNEYIFRAYKKIKRFREILQENNETLSLKLASEILLQILKSDTIPFESKANQGLQIMGLMESRNLDFENIIILGMNEGNLPKISGAPTFISQNMRYAFGLPLTKHQDAVFAYFFYRLLQRAKNVTLIYNDLVSDGNSGEMSRFIKQLLYETDFKINHSHFNDEIYMQARQAIEIPKDDIVLKKLKFFIYDNKKPETVKAFSASAFNTYLSCSLKFYYKYVAGIKEPESHEDEFTPADFGSVLHLALELIYSDLRNKNNLITKNLLEEKIPDSEKYVSEAFKLFYNIKTYKPEGIQIIVKDVLTNYIKSILKYDIKQSPFEIISMEKQKYYDTLLNVNINLQQEQIKLLGIIDRIDKKDTIYKIIDYKSGQMFKGNFSINSLFDKNNKKRNSHLFQALFYILIIKKTPEFTNADLKPALYYARSINQPDFSELPVIKEDFGTLQTDENVVKMVLPNYQHNLVQLVEEIFDKNTSFSMTNNSENCKYCEFNKICY